MTKQKLRCGTVVLTTFISDVLETKAYAIEKQVKIDGRWSNDNVFNIKDIKNIHTILTKLLNDTVVEV